MWGARLLVLLPATACALVVSGPTRAAVRHVAPPMRFGSGQVAASAAVEQWATEEQIGPYIKIGRKQDKVINWYGGILFALPALLVGTIWYVTMCLMEPVLVRTGWDDKRRWFDWTGRVWNFIVLRTTGNYPRVITGLENIPKQDEAALICANHASWYDILLAGYTIRSNFKFVSAAELAELPGVGKQLYGGKHVLIDRKSRKGQLRSFKDSVKWLSKGVSVFAFPEGTRSRDGRLQRFKPGVFAMATKANVPIVPVSIVNAFKPYPPNALLPIQKATDMEIHFHAPISSANRTEAELEELVRAAIASKLGPDQLPEVTAGGAAQKEAVAA